VKCKLVQTLAILVSATIVATASHGEDVNVQPDPGENGHAAALTAILNAWPARPFPDEIGGVELTCIATPGEERYVGIVRRTIVRAPIAAVEDILEDVAHYKDLFPNTVDVRVVSGSPSGSRFATRWEQRVPLVFIPNVHYELTHVVDRGGADRRVYRYRLRHGDRLLASDGMAVVEASGPRTTRFTEYGFFHARTGPMPVTLVWRESVRAAYLGNAAIKLKAENPDWSYERVAAESRRLLAADEARVSGCVTSRYANALREEIVEAAHAPR